VLHRSHHRDAPIIISANSVCVFVKSDPVSAWMRPAAEFFVNPARRRDAPAATSPPPSAAFHRRLPEYSRTRIVDASGLAGELDLAALSVKDESRRLGLPSFKILGASWAVYRLLVRRLGREPAWDGIDELRRELGPLGPLTLVAATDGNHGRAVAHMATLLGYGSRIFVPAGTAAARIDGIAGEGAAVTVVDGSYEDAVRASAALADDDVLVVSDTSWEGYTQVPSDVIDGYETIFAEADAQLAAPPDVVVVPMGVGALAAATVRHYAANATIAVVEPLSAACGFASAVAGHPVEVPPPHNSIMAGLNCGTVSIVAWPAVASGTDVFVAIDDPAAERAMRDLAGLGVVAGETGAASLAGLRALVEADAADVRGRRVLVLCTEGATDPENYRRIVGREP
jgi:diaminopropionate ammonia-lyase